MELLLSRPAPTAARLPRWRAHLLPALALAGSLALAAVMASAPHDDAAGPSASGNAVASAHELQAMTERLQSRLAAGSADAQDAASWALLARSHVALRAWGAADGSYGQALRLAPLNAAWLAERAQVRVLSGAGADRDDVKRLVGLALVADAAQPLALALSGDAAYERGEFAQARERWLAAQQHAERGDLELHTTLARRLASLEHAQNTLGTINR
jgi:cytochrome c-type biogenesis protein CcmH/NrfG